MRRRWLAALCLLLLLCSCRAKGGVTLTVRGVRYSTVISLTVERSNAVICYDMNDGSGVSVGLGGRIEPAEGLTLYAQWSKWSPAELFQWRGGPDGVTVTAYLGAEDTVTVPGELGGQPVRAIGAEAFQNAACDTVILPGTLYALEDGAFRGCALSTLHLNTVEPPVYSGTYYDTFQDKFDRLVSLKGRKKIVLFAADFDEDGVPVDSPSYNQYGDYVVYRPNAPTALPVYGAPIHYTYSPRNSMALSEDSTPAARAALDSYLRENLCVPVITELEDSLWSGVHLYGTDNHLSTEGAAIHTERVIAALRVQMEREEIVTYREADHDLLMDIRSGRYQGADHAFSAEFYDLLNDLEKRLEYAKQNTSLPETPDLARIEAFQMEVNKRVVRDEI